MVLIILGYVERQHGAPPIRSRKSDTVRLCHSRSDSLSVSYPSCAETRLLGHKSIRRQCGNISVCSHVHPSLATLSGSAEGA